MNIGDKVVCNKAAGSTFLRTWKKYELVSENQHGNWQVKEVDTGLLSTHWYKADRFEVIETAKKPAVAKHIGTMNSTPTKLNLEARYKTRSGLLVKLYTNEGADPKSPVVGSYRRETGDWVNCAWQADGKYPFGNTFDLVELPYSIEIPIEDKGKAIVYNDGSVYLEQCGSQVTLNEQNLRDIYAALLRIV
jgi:hypothetical protein